MMMTMKPPGTLWATPGLFYLYIDVFLFVPNCTASRLRIHCHSEHPEPNTDTESSPPGKISGFYNPQTAYEGVLISPQPDLLLYVVGQNRQCRWKEGSVHAPNCKSFLVTEAEWKHVRRLARFQQHRDASCHQVPHPVSNVEQQPAGWSRSQLPLIHQATSRVSLSSYRTSYLRSSSVSQHTVSFMYIYSYLFCLYWCKDCCHRLTTQLQLVLLIITDMSTREFFLGGEGVKAAGVYITSPDCLETPETLGQLNFRNPKYLSRPAM